MRSDSQLRAFVVHAGEPRTYSGYALDLLEAGRRLLATNTVNWKGTRYLSVFEIFQKDQKQLEASLFREKPDGNGPGNIVK
jgi:hypothetical protein